MTYFVILESSTGVDFHVTLLPGFYFDEERLSLSDFVNELEAALSGFDFEGGVSLVGEAEEVFVNSNGGDVPVLTISEPVVTEAHLALLGVARGFGVKFVNELLIGEGYRAHVSGADSTTELPVFDFVSLSKLVDGRFETVRLNPMRSRSIEALKNGEAPR